MHVYVQSYHDLHLACFRAVRLINQNICAEQQKRKPFFFSYYVMIKEIKRLWVIKMSHKSAKCIHGFSDIDEYKGLTFVT